MVAMAREVAAVPKVIRGSVVVHRRRCGAAGERKSLHRVAERYVVGGIAKGKRPPAPSWPEARMLPKGHRGERGTWNMTP